MITIFNKAFSRDIAVFTFDNSSGHACKTKDTLIANRINLHPDGKQLKMHNMKWENEIEQSIVFLEGDKKWDTNISILSELIENLKEWRKFYKSVACGRKILKSSAVNKRRISPTLKTVCSKKQ